MQKYNFDILAWIECFGFTLFAGISRREKISTIRDYIDPSRHTRDHTSRTCGTGGSPFWMHFSITDSCLEQAFSLLLLMLLAPISSWVIQRPRQNSGTLWSLQQDFGSLALSLIFSILKYKHSNALFQCYDIINMILIRVK